MNRYLVKEDIQRVNKYENKLNTIILCEFLIKTPIRMAKIQRFECTNFSGECGTTENLIYC